MAGAERRELAPKSRSEKGTAMGDGDGRRTDVDEIIDERLRTWSPWNYNVTNIYLIVKLIIN